MRLLPLERRVKRLRREKMRKSILIVLVLMMLIPFAGCAMNNFERYRIGQEIKLAQRIETLKAEGKSPTELDLVLAKQVAAMAAVKAKDLNLSDKVLEDMKLELPELMALAEQSLYETEWWIDLGTGLPLVPMVVDIAKIVIGVILGSGI